MQLKKTQQNDNVSIIHRVWKAGVSSLKLQNNGGPPFLKTILSMENKAALLFLTSVHMLTSHWAWNINGRVLFWNRESDLHASVSTERFCVHFNTRFWVLVYGKKSWSKADVWTVLLNYFYLILSVNLLHGGRQCSLFKRCHWKKCKQTFFS